MWHLQGTREYIFPEWDEDPGSKAKPNLARIGMHYDSKTVRMLVDPTGLYRTGVEHIEVAFNWPEFIYTAALGHWPEGALFVITPAGESDKRIVKIINRQVVDVETGERLFCNLSGHKWEYAWLAEKLWGMVRLGAAVR